MVVVENREQTCGAGCELNVYNIFVCEGLSNRRNRYIVTPAALLEHVPVPAPNQDSHRADLIA